MHLRLGMESDETSYSDDSTDGEFSYSSDSEDPDENPITTTSTKKTETIGRAVRSSSGQLPKLHADNPDESVFTPNAHQIISC